jgi:hypothetical protein
MARNEANAHDDDGGEDQDETESEARGEAHFSIVEAASFGVVGEKLFRFSCSDFLL